MSSVNLGRIGESTVRKYLEDKGYTFVAQNVHVGHDEIDLIMLDGRVTVFVEVKLRKPGVSGAEAVNLAKRRRTALLKRQIHHALRQIHRGKGAAAGSQYSASCRRNVSFNSSAEKISRRDQTGNQKCCQRYSA